MRLVDWYLVGGIVVLLVMDYIKTILLASTEGLLWVIAPENMAKIHGSRERWVIKRRRSALCFIPLPTSCFEEAK